MKPGDEITIEIDGHRLADEPRRRRARCAGRLGLLAGLFLAGLALRPQIVGVGPLIPSIQDDLDISHAVAGLLGTIPVLCMGVFALPASAADEALRHAAGDRSLPRADRRLRDRAGGRPRAPPA